MRRTQGGLASIVQFLKDGLPLKPYRRRTDIKIHEKDVKRGVKN